MIYLQEVIVKYNGNIAALGYGTEILSDNYAILTLPEAEIPRLRNFVEIEYIELPKRLSFSILESADSACIPAAQRESGYNLSGEGVLVAVIDSGIDYRHPDFINDDGTSRVQYIWDQSVAGTPPKGFLRGAEYSNAQINAALAAREPYSVVPHQDFMGHGTAVAGIAAGNGRASGGAEKGVAYASAVIAVKLGERENGRFSRTTEIMRAVKYVYDKARAMNMPLAVNLSCGTNEGAHDGDSLFETYIDAMSDRWKGVIVAASGNEGAARHHYRYQISKGEPVDVAFSVAAKLSALTVGVYKNFADTFTLELIAPSGIATGALEHTAIPRLVHFDGVLMRVAYRQPTHYSMNCEVLLNLEAESEGGEITQGVWTLKVTGVEVADGKFDVWLPTVEEVSTRTAFMVPSLETTLTIPSSAKKVITVGGYDASTGGIAPFSGRGYTRENIYAKPDLAAPAVNVRSCRAGGGYGQFTGTSIAAPFVTGAAALMMQWGIVRRNDFYLYGERVKAFLRKGAARDAAAVYPNNTLGYGTLCLQASMDYLSEYKRAAGP